METPNKIIETARKLLTDQIGSSDLLIVHAATDTHPETRQPIHLVSAVPSGDPNAKHVEIIVDDAGRPIELANRAASFLPVFAPVPPEIFAPFRVTIDPAANDLRLGECDKITETITVTIPKSAATLPADVYFLADNTGSMGPVITAVKSGVNVILNALKSSGFNLHYGVGEYHDFVGIPVDGFHSLLALTPNAALVPPAVSTWSTFGGADLAEAQLFALDQIAQPPGGSIGWRAGAKHIVVWLGDAPGHDPICKAISGLPYDITEASVTAKLQANNITVLAISTKTTPLVPLALDDDPVPISAAYQPVCGAPGGKPGQAKRIAAATGGIDATGINPAQIVQTIINQVIVLLGIKNVHLQPVGAIAPFVTSITPPNYGPLDPTKDNVLKFQVTFSGGAVDCTTRDQVFTGAIDVVADGSVVAAKPTRITVPACKYTYGVKFVCGTQRELPQEHGCAPVRPGSYATEINILNPKCKSANILKRIVPVMLRNEPIGREPRVSEVHATDRIILPPGAATMDDCCRIDELLKVGPSPSLNIGFLEIISDQELHVTAVYTATDLRGNNLSMDVVIVPFKLT